jgi:phage N-6-adenine-methyltransferase
VTTTTNRSALYSSVTDNWPTPQDFYDRLDAEFGFELDVCSSRANRKAPSYFALDHEDVDRRDGLEADWSDGGATGTVWMNPPYGKTIREWMSKAFDTAHTTGRTVVCLVPVRSSSQWWHDLVLNTGAEVRYVKGRLTFGDATNSAAFASAVVIYRPSDVVGTPGEVSAVVNKVKAAPAPKSSQAAAPHELAAPVVSPVPGEGASAGSRGGTTPRHSVTAPDQGGVVRRKTEGPVAASNAGCLKARREQLRISSGTDAGAQLRSALAELEMSPRHIQDGPARGNIRLVAGSDHAPAAPPVRRTGPRPRKGTTAPGVRDWQERTPRHQSQS